MAPSDDLIDFDVIEGQKENIQSLPGGRSARKLAELYTQSPLQKIPTPNPSDTQTINDSIRAEYEAEVQNISEADDPLDVYDRYVRWTLDAYPSAQATPQSQLNTLLERATKAFISASQYKNDPRYLKLWMHYIHFFSDAPRESYVFLSRHGIGEGLALFYEEYAAWLEAAGRWAQAEEVYKLGIEREARPVQRLLRKFKEFEARLAQQPEALDEPSSPALPSVRPALAAKLDPFGGASRPTDPQAQRQPSGTSSSSSSRPTKSKLAIFSDADAKAPAMSSRGPESKGWDTIGSISDRKKENVMEPKPWAGETLKAGGKKSSAAAKMMVFRDPSLSSQINNIVVVPSKNQVTVHPQTGKKERIFIDLTAVYPTPEEPGTELSFEEIMAANRGWLDQSWPDESVDQSLVPEPAPAPLEIEQMAQDVAQKLVIHRDGPMYDENGAVMNRTPPRVSHKKKKVMEVNETQIIKAKLDSPSGPKLRKKNASEPTMTLHTKAATDDIYDIFNAPLRPVSQEEDGDSDNDEDDYETDGDYTTDAESTGTTRQIDVDEQDEDEDEEEDEEEEEEEEEDEAQGEVTEAKSVSEWSDFSTRRHIPNINDDGDDHVEDEDGEQRENDTQVSDLIDTSVPGSDARGEDEDSYEQEAEAEEREDDSALATPVDDESPPRTRTSFIPIPPEDYEPPTRPYRDPAEVANNRLPFMTPITERTESSLDVDMMRSEHSKTPSRRRASPASTDEQFDLEPLSSPLREIINEAKSSPQVSKPLAPKPAVALGKPKPLALKGPIIKEAQCNPVDEAVRNEILSKVQPSLASYGGFHDHRNSSYEHGGDIRRYAKALSKASKGGGADKIAPVPAPIVIAFPDGGSTYKLKRELGAGAFAPVYLVEREEAADGEDENGAGDGEKDENAVSAMGKGAFATVQRGHVEALKMETPPTAWEFYMMRVAHARLGPQHRASASLSYAHEMHLWQDEAFLFLPYHPHGTLLDVVNFFRADSCGVMDEQLAMFFTIELLRTVEALHAKQVLHGDLKPDNCLLRLDASSSEQPLGNQWRADGGDGWAARGVVLIDFGRGIDMRSFAPDVEFIADWKTSAQDCAEMREGRPWTWQIDYHGLAGIVHCLLFGKYIETVRCDQGGLGRGGRRYRIRESLKRYWQTDLWAACFDVLLNPGSFLDAEDGARMPVLRSMKRVREDMEQWLGANCEKGVGLKSLMSKVETYARSRKV